MNRDFFWLTIAFIIWIAGTHLFMSISEKEGACKATCAAAGMPLPKYYNNESGCWCQKSKTEQVLIQIPVIEEINK